MTRAAITDYVRSQQSLHLYKNIQAALIDVLGKLPDEVFIRVRDHLIIMAVHDGVSGQVMHFEPRDDAFAVMQLYIPRDMPGDVLRWVVAHELGHVLQGRNWVQSDGIKLEADATNFAQKIGYKQSKNVRQWLAAKGM